MTMPCPYDNDGDGVCGRTVCDECPSTRAYVAGLEHWKAEALEVLDRWEEVWEAADWPGPYGASKADNVKAFIEQQAAELAEFKQWASDACELLHHLRDVWVDADEDQAAITDLLHRMENP